MEMFACVCVCVRVCMYFVCVFVCVCVCGVKGGLCVDLGLVNVGHVISPVRHLFICIKSLYFPNCNTLSPSLPFVWSLLAVVFPICWYAQNYVCVCHATTLTRVPSNAVH